MTRKEYVDAFIRAFEGIFSGITGKEATVKSIEETEEAIPSYEVAALVGIIGFIRGQMSLSTDLKAARDLVKVVLPGREGTKDVEKSAVGELANMVAGRVTIELAGEDKKLYLTPPAVVLGSNLKVAVPGVKVSVVKFDTYLGEFEITVGLIES